MPSLRAALVLLSFLVAFGANAATHTWTGSASSNFSDAANWNGGSPAGDWVADLVFPPGARLNASNDLNNLLVRSITFTGIGYSIGGNPIAFDSGDIVSSAAGTNVITCELVSNDVLRFRGLQADAVLKVASQIRGAGAVEKRNAGTVTFEGSLPNTFAGPMRVIGGELQLNKSAGVVAIPDDMDIGYDYDSTDPYAGALLTTLADEQIADTGHLRVWSGSFILKATENSQLLTVDGSARIFTDGIGQFVLRDAVHFRGYDASMRGNILFRGVVTIHAEEVWGSRIESLGTDDPAAELHIESPSGGWLPIQGTYAAPTIIHSGHLKLDNWNSDVTCAGGTFTGNAKSITVTSGALRRVSELPASSQTYVRLGPGSKVIADYFSPIVKLNGDLEINGAELVVDSWPAPYPEAVYTFVRNDSSEPVRGTLAGLPEGLLIDGHLRFSYLGGDGNDVTLTDLEKYRPDVRMYFDNFTLVDGDSLGVTVRMYEDFRDGPVPTGTVTISCDGIDFATVPLVNGVAEATLMRSAGTYALRARYSGDDRNYPVVGDEHHATWLLPRPVITEIVPSTVENGSTTTITVKGSGFKPGAEVYAYNGHVSEYVSPNEIRFVFVAPIVGTNLEVPLVVNQTGHGQSLPVTLTVLPGPPCPFIFDRGFVTARVTPGTTSAWLASVSGNFYGNLVPDDDRDGIATWTQGWNVNAWGFWILTDVAAESIVAARQDYVCQPTEPLVFPSGMFIRDALGEFSKIGARKLSSEAGYFWLRPGVGLWGRRGVDGIDEDGVVNGIVLLSASSMQPLSGSGPPPGGVLPGDYFIAFDHSGYKWYGAKVDAYLTPDPQAPGTLSFASSEVVVDQDAGVARLDIVRNGGSHGKVSVSLNTEDGSAVAERHYTPLSGWNLYFEHGEISRTIEVPLIRDFEYTGNLDFRVVLTDPKGTTISQPASVRVVIRDAENPDHLPGLISFASSEDILVNEDAGVARIELRRIGGAEGEVSVRWRTVSSASPTPYEHTEGTAVFAHGETSKTLEVPIIDEAWPTGNRSFQIMLTDPVGTAIKGSIYATVVVVDLDGPHPGFVSLPGTVVRVNEDAGVARVVLSRTDGALGQVSVRWWTDAVTAVAGLHFTPSEGIVTFANRETTKTIEVPVIDNAVHTGDAMFQVAIGDPVGTMIKGPNWVDVVVVDLDVATPQPGVISFASSADVVVDESVNLVAIGLTRSGGSAGEISVRWHTEPRTAVPGLHFEASSGVVTFGPGELSKSIEVVIIDNAVHTGDTMFEVVLTEPAGTTIAGPTSLSVFIVDLEDAPPSGVISFTNGGVIVVAREDAGVARVELLRSAGSEGEVSVRWHTVAGSALAGMHFESSSGIVNFGPGEISKTIEVPILDNNVYTGDASFQVVLTDPVGTTISGPASVTVQIIDLENAPPPTRPRPVRRG